VVKQDRLPFPGSRRTCHAVEGLLKVIAGVCGGAGSYTRVLPVFGRARAGCLTTRWSRPGKPWVGVFMRYKSWAGQAA